MDKQNVMEAEQITGAYIGRKSDTCGDNMAYHWIIVVTGGEGCPCRFSLFRDIRMKHFFLEPSILRTSKYITHNAIYTSFKYERHPES